MPQKTRIKTVALTLAGVFLTGLFALFAPSQSAQAQPTVQSPPQKSVNSRPSANRRLARDAVVSLQHADEYTGDWRVGSYVSSTRGFSTVSYWIEGPSGLILIDTQFLPSAAEEFITWAEQATGKRARAAFVLHANPDKFNGTAVFKKRGIKVMTSDQVLALIPSVDAQRRRVFFERFEDDYPKDLVLPESFGSESVNMDLAGLNIKAHVVGQGCSDAHIVVQFEDHLFTGDLVASGSHSWLELARTEEWLKRLEEMKSLGAKTIHPGRGPSGDLRLLDQEAAYLRFVRDTIAAEKPRLGASGDIDDAGQAAIERVRKKIEDRFLGYRFAVFLNLGLPAEWTRQAKLAKP
ncbi:MAG: MBL fold metallo-hydrolase [Myxococcales bacterium]|nr:MBL fold metallo-hydrolase [Myxococcales bacterium]